MGAKRYGQEWAVKNHAVSTTLTFQSAAVDVRNFDNIGFQAVWTGTPTGTLSVLGSVSQEIPTSTTVYVPITFDPDINAGAPSGSAGDLVWNITDCQYPWLKFQYTNASGSGVINLFISYKDKN